jgi:hypothetical protein
MKKIILPIFAGLLIVCTVFTARAQTSPATTPPPGVSNPWTNSQLIEPAELAANIKAGEAKTPIIFNIGAVEDIKGAIHIGAVNSAENLEKLKEAVAALSKGSPIVIYCGCCPFAKCPNIRPAFIELQKLGFTNVKLLNLATNLKTNWIAKGYPLTKE